MIYYYERGPKYNLVVSVFDQGFDRLVVNVILPVRFNFVGFSEPKMTGHYSEFIPLSDMIEEWKEKFADVVDGAWTPSFQLFRESRNKTASLLFSVLDIEGDSLHYDDFLEHAKSKDKNVEILRVKVFPGSGDGAHSTSWASEISLLAGDVLEEKKGETSSGKPIMQIDAAHEVGHALGFNHPCGTYGADSYCDPSSKNALDIMGLGMDAWAAQQRLFKGILHDVIGGQWRIFRPGDQHSFQDIRPQDGEGVGRGSFMMPGPAGWHRDYFA